MTIRSSAVCARFEPHGLSAFTFGPSADHSDDQRWCLYHTHLELDVHFVGSGRVTLDQAGRTWPTQR